MAAVKTCEALLLLSCLFLLAASSPLNDKNLFAPRASRSHRIKTVVPAAQHQSSSLSSKSSDTGVYPNPDSSVARFDSSQKTAAAEVNTQGSAGKQAEYDSLTPNSATQTLRTRGSHSPLPAISNFGDRIQNRQSTQSSGCRVKGGCSVQSFTSDASTSKSKITPVENNVQRDFSQNVDRVVPEQQKILISGMNEIKQTVHTQQSNDRNENVHNSPDYEGLISPHEFSAVSAVQPPPIQDERLNVQNVGFTDTEVPQFQNEQIQTSVDNVATFINQSPFKSDFANQMQYVTQQDFSEYTDTQQNENNRPGQVIAKSNKPGDFVSSSSGFSESDFQANIEQTNFGGTTQTDQKSFPQVSTTNGERPVEIHQQVTSQPEFPISDGHDVADDGQYYHYGNPIDWLRYSVPGNPGEDYPILYQVPETSFDCKQQQFQAGIFGDMEASCQVFHICKDNGEQASFLCPNGTVFNQQYFVCDWWYNFRCSDTPTFYNLNADLYWDWDSFTPQQVLNVPAGDNQANSNFQGSFQDTSNGISQDGNTAPVHEISSPHDAIKSTIAVDNSAVADKNVNIHQQGIDEHIFADRQSTQSNTQNIFQNRNQNTQIQQNFQTSFTPALGGTTDKNVDIHQQGIEEHFFADRQSTQSNTQNIFQNRNQNTQIQQNFPTSFTPAFGGTTRGLQPTTVSPLGSNLETKPVSSSFGNHNNVRNDNTILPLSSDTGANRQTGGEAGTRYPDQGIYRQQSAKVDRPISQNPTSFVSQNQIVDNTFRSDQNFQNNNEEGKNQASRFDFAQQTVTDLGKNDGTHHTQTQEVQQEYLNDSFDRNTPSTFQTDKTEQTYDMNENYLTTQNQNSGGIATNQGHEHTNVNQFPVIQEDQRPTTPFVPESNVFSGIDGGSTQQNESPLIQSQISVHDETNNFRDGAGQNNRNEVLSVHKQDTDNSNLQQEHVLASFDSGSDSSFKDQNSENFGPQNENTFAVQDVGSTTFEGNENFGNVGSGVNFNTERNPNIHQDQIKISFDSEDQRVQGTGSYNENFGTGNNQQEAFNVNEGNFNQNQNTRQNFVSQDNDAFRGVQQEYVPYDLNMNNVKHDSVAHSNINHQQAPTLSQPSDQNVPVNSNQQGQIVRGNQHGIQQQISVPFNEHDQNSFDSRRNHNTPAFSSNSNQGSNFISNNQDFSNSNNNQMTEEKPASNQLDNSQFNKNRDSTNNIQSDFSNSKSFDQANQNVQQENIIFPFDAGNQDSFTQINKENQNEFSVVPNQQTSRHTSNVPGHQITNQINIPSDNQQNRLSTGFDDKSISGPFAVGNTNEVNPQNQNIQNSNSNQNHDSLFRQNVPVNEQVQQEFVQTTFEGMQPNVFGLPGNERNAIMQNDYENVEQGNQFNANDQNVFNPSFSGHQENNRIHQNVRQEHVQISLDNNQQIFAQNSFDQSGNFGIFQHLNNDNYQSNTFIRNRDEINQNTNAAFQIRQSNFHPGNIYMMNRGGLQNQNHQQQRLSFRPYGQNDQNVVNFPGNSQGPFPLNQQNIDLPAHSNDQGPSNSNFFVTNGHQIQNNHPHSSSNQPLSNEHPHNNVHEVRQHNLEQFNQGDSNHAVAHDDSKTRVAQNQDINHQDFSSGNVNANSQIKGQFTRDVNSRSFQTPQVAENQSQQHSAVPFKADDNTNFSQEAPESPSSMNYNGWRPVRKY